MKQVMDSVNALCWCHCCCCCGLSFFLLYMCVLHAKYKCVSLIFSYYIILYILFSCISLARTKITMKKKHKTISESSSAGNGSIQGQIATTSNQGNNNSIRVKSHVCTSSRLLKCLHPTNTNPPRLRWGQA